jgi:flagellar hook-associated protein 2
MSGISTGTGLFSGINTQQLISQILAVESRPKMLAQRRMAQLQGQQAAYLDINSRISALKTSAASFRLNKTFQSHAAVSSHIDILTATASTSALPGSYSFIVDRMVTSQQLLSRGFANASTAGLNAGSFSFEPVVARLDRDTSLSDLNGGAGVQRGKIIISDSSGKNATIDLSRVGTVNEVLEAINSAEAIDVTASVEGGRFILRSDSGADLTVRSTAGFTTAESLGIARATAAGPTVTGSVVYQLGGSTSLGTLNDGNGIFRNPATGNARFDFRITVSDGNGNVDTVNVNIGDILNAENVVTESAPTTLGGVITRINAALRETVGDEDIIARIAADGVSLEIVDSQNRTIEVLEHPTARSTAAADLGLKTGEPQVGQVSGRRILAGINSTLTGLLNGGRGIAGDGSISITARDGTIHNLSIDPGGSIGDILAAINGHASGKFSAALSSTGTGIVLSDVSGGTGNFIVLGASAESLGIATDETGVGAARVGGKNLQRQYITAGTALATLRNNQGVGTGRFRIFDSTGNTAEVNITSEDRTLDDIISKINSRGTLIRARINAGGDGLELYEDSPESGTLKIRVQDEAGAVAANLNIKGESASGEVGQNTINGSFERTVTFAAGDTLEQIAQKINAAGVGVAASIINDGGGTAPFRLSLTSRHSGAAGRFILDTGGLELGASQLEAGQDARVFFGATDPARAVLLTSSRNTLDNVITGVTIDLKQTSASPVTLTVSRDQAAMETAVNGFLEAFNGVIGRISHQTRYDKDSNTRGPLLGDGNVIAVRSSLYNAVQGRALNITGSFERLTDVGITVGSGGTLQLNRDRFRQALEQDPQGVAELFAARVQVPRTPVQFEPGITINEPDAPDEFSSLGVASIVENLSESFINSLNGSLTRKNNGLTTQIELQNKRIADYDLRLTSRRGILERQFLAMERAIGKLQTQQGSIGQISLLRR